MGNVLHAMGCAQDGEGGAVLQQMRYGLAGFSTVPACWVHGLVDSILIGEEGRMVSASQSGQVDSGLSG